MTTATRPRAAQGTVTLFQPKGTQRWYLRYSHGGKQHVEPTKTGDRKVAERLRKTREAELQLGLAAPEAGRTTFDELAQMVTDDFTVNKKPALERTEDALNHLRARFGGWKVTAITSDAITTYQRQRQAEGAANSTINRECGVLKRALRLGLRAGKARTTPHISMLDPAPPRAGFFERHELDALVQYLPEYLRPVAEVFYLTGWRKREVLDLTWSRVDLREGTIRLDPGTTKNREGRVFPFAALPLLGGLLRAQRDRVREIERQTSTIIPFVFVNPRGGRIGAFRKSWATACRKAGLTSKLVHDFRRTSARNMERAGVPRSVAMKLIGHKTEAIYRRYTIVNEHDLGVGVAMLADLHARDTDTAAERVVVPFAALGKT